MDARPTLGRSGKRLALATCAVALVSAVSSGPALAESGLSSVLSGVTESLPPAVSDPVDDVGSSVEPALEATVEQAQAPVDAVVATVEQTTELADATVSGGLAGVGQTVDSTLGTVDETAAAVSGAGLTPSTAPPAANARPTSTAAPADTTARPADTVAVLPSASAEPASSGAARRMSDAALPGGGPVPRPRATDSGPSGVLESSANGPVQASTTHTVPTGEGPAAAGRESREAVGAAPRSPEAPSHGAALGLESLVPQPPAPAVLIAALLGLLALAVPRIGVALLHPADVRFRLVRPG